MPRIYDSSGEPLDFCRGCFPTEPMARSLHGTGPEGPDGRGNCFAYDAAHPDYDEDPFAECSDCFSPLYQERDA